MSRREKPCRTCDHARDEHVWMNGAFACRHGAEGDDSGASGCTCTFSRFQPKADEPWESVHAENDFKVARVGGSRALAILNLSKDKRSGLERNEALLLAAWLVVLAGDSDRERYRSDVAFDDVLKKVRADLEEES